MIKSNIDLSVLLIFFARPNTLEPVFKKVKEARPSKLFLACDGARENNERDVEAIEQCKKIVEDIDWECEVYTNYSTQNLGCGRGPSNAISWAFEHTDKLLILEDDCVPDETLFPFMAEMLEKYKDDERVGIISGFNHFKDWDCGEYSYCFTKTGATLGWGTWKRVWEKYDYILKDMDEKYCQKLLSGAFKDDRMMKARMGSWRKAVIETRTKKVNYWDVQFGFLKYAQSYLCVVPKGNLIYNIGVGAGSTHTENTKESKWKLGKILFMPTVPMQFPLKHPNYMICDSEYDEKSFRMINPNKFVRVIRKIKRKLKIKEK
ncbi:MAG: hemolysin activation protein [Clostridia bacterium]|nr:hemolysin activation protein [Clostridia bacterium]